MQARAGVAQLAQVGDDLGGDALARQQRRDARRVAGDRLARDAADGVVDAARPPPRRGTRRAARPPSRSRAPGRRAPARRPSPAREIRLTVSSRSRATRSSATGGCAMPEHQHHRRVRRQLGAARRRRRAARRRPRSRCSRSRARRSTIRSGSQPATPGRPTNSLADEREPGIVADRFARVRAAAAIVSCSSASPWTASWRRAASSEAISSERRRRRAHEPHGARDRVASRSRPVVRDVQHRRTA